MMYKLIPFLLLGIIILLGAHLIVYHFIINFFSISAGFYQNIILILLIFLALSFFFASILAHWHDNIFTRTFYFLSASWLGALTNLVLAAGLGWLTFYALKALHYTPNKLWIAIPFLLLAVLISLYGIYNAFHPRVKNVSVAINNLPDSWKNKTIVQISDLHLGHIYRDDFLRETIARINRLNPDLVVITGDLFDGMDGKLEKLTAPLKDLKATKGIFYVTGNHETYLGIEKSLSALGTTTISVLNDKMENIDGLQILGISYPERESSKNITAILRNFKDKILAAPTVLLYHSPACFREAKENGIALQLSGHTHKGQQFPFGFITKYIYEGYDYGLHKLENFYLYTTNGTGTWGPPMRLGNSPEIVVITLN